MKKIFTDKNGWVMVAILVLFLLVEISFLIIFRETWFDELLYQVKALRFITGEYKPFIDTIIEYPPLFIPLYGVAQSLFGPSIIVGRIVSSVLFILSLVVGSWCVRKISNNIYAVAFLLALISSNTLLVGNYVSATLYSLSNFLLFLLFAFELASSDEDRDKYYWSGIFSALLLMARTDLLPAVIVYFLYLLFLAKKQWVFSVKYLSALALTLVLGYMPILIDNPTLAVAHILAPLTKVGVLTNLPASAKDGGVFLMDQLLTLVEFFKEYYSFVLLFCAASFAMFVENNKYRKELILLFLIILSLFFSHFAYLKFSSHIYYANYFVALMALFSCALLFSKEQSNPPSRIFIAFVILISFAGSFIRTDVFSSPGSETDLERIDRGATFVADTIPAGSKIIVLDNSTFHIFVAKRDTFPKLWNREFLLLRDANTEKVLSMGYYNFDIFKQWLEKDADYYIVQKEHWPSSLIRMPFWSGVSEDTEAQIRNITDIVQNNYVEVGRIENVYPRKYTEGNDGGTLIIYKRKI